MYQVSSVTQLYPTLCDPMDCSTPGFPLHHQLPEFAQTPVHRVGDALKPSHLLSSPSPPAFNLPQHQRLFQWVSYSYQVAKVLVSASASVLPMHTQDWFPLGQTGWISLQSKGISRVFSNTTVCGSAGKESTCNAGDLGLIPGLGRSPGGGKGYPLQYSGLENSMDCIDHGVTKRHDWVTFTFHPPTNPFI